MDSPVQSGKNAGTIRLFLNGQVGKREARLASLFSQLPPPRYILEIGSGRTPGTPFYFTDTPIVAVDSDAEALRAAHRATQHPCFYSVQADAANLPLPIPLKQFDLIVVRHPDLDKTPDRWGVIFQHILGGVCGILVTTTYSALEMDMLRGWLSTWDAYPIRYQHLTATALDGSDRFVIVSQQRR